MSNRLYVRNLADSVDSDALEEIFSSVGSVTTASVEIKSIRGSDHRVGYVEMSSLEEAVDSIGRFHGQKVHGNVLIVTEDRPHIPVIGSQKLKTKNKSAFKSKGLQ